MAQGVSWDEIQQVPRVPKTLADNELYYKVVILNTNSHAINTNAQPHKNYYSVLDEPKHQVKTPACIQEMCVFYRFRSTEQYIH